MRGKRQAKIGYSRKKRCIDISVKSFEKDFNVKLGVKPDMKLSTYLKKKGFVSLGEALEKAACSR
ncbi:MAG: hypothetical protein FJZ04_00565 [Candidatus Moranbacteria bacterium]|nr:hypothetical protein [Candidatus Moranbacteria bacterium]